jgi:hypothetical protein
MKILFYFITWHFGPVGCDTVRKLMHQTTQIDNLIQQWKTILREKRV